MRRKDISSKDSPGVCISGCVYHDIMKTIGSVSPEMGGILGVRGNIIEKFFFDGQHSSYEKKESVYIPDISKLNSVLQSWYEEGITFAGVIHSHPLDMRKLSAEDVVYANCIMKENGLKYVHFPLVFPDDGTIIWYEVSSGGAVNELTYEVEKDF